MANNFNANPVVLDADIASFSAVAPACLIPVRVRKMALVVGGSTSTAGTVLVQDSAGNNLLAPMLVTAQPANTILFADGDFNSRAVPWPKDFKVTGLTATGTQLYIWSE